MGNTRRRESALESWRADQPEAYIRLVHRAIEADAGDPRRGGACDEVGAGYRTYLVGSHMLLCRELHEGIDIVRILHGRMDFEPHL